ncbi:hypothetical protein ACJX0J_021934, partial [Zea mays]
KKASTLTPLHMEEAARLDLHRAASENVTTVLFFFFPFQLQHADVRTFPYHLFFFFPFQLQHADVRTFPYHLKVTEILPGMMIRHWICFRRSFVISTTIIS